VNLTVVQVTALGKTVGLRLTLAEAQDLLPIVARNLQFGEELLEATDTDVLPTDDPRWTHS